MVKSLMQLTPEQSQTIISWAEGLPKVAAVFLLGDRAHGTVHPDSDIELGLALSGTESWWTSELSKSPSFLENEVGEVTQSSSAS